MFKVKVFWNDGTNILVSMKFDNPFLLTSKQISDFIFKVLSDLIKKGEFGDKTAKDIKDIDVTYSTN